MQVTVVAESSNSATHPTWFPSTSGIFDWWRVLTPFSRRPKMAATWSHKRKDHLCQSKLGADFALFDRLHPCFSNHKMWRHDRKAIQGTDDQIQQLKPVVRVCRAPFGYWVISRGQFRVEVFGSARHHRHSSGTQPLACDISVEPARGRAEHHVQRPGSEKTLISSIAV